MKRSIKRPILAALMSTSLAFSLCPLAGVAQAYAEESATDDWQVNEQVQTGEQASADEQAQADGQAQADEQAQTDEQTQADNQTQENEQTESQAQENEAHTHNEITFEAWEAANGLPSTAGNYYLANDVVLDGTTWVVPEGTTNLCLNGKTIKGINMAVGSCAVTVPSGATLNLFDCQNIGKITNEGTDVSGVAINEGGSFTMNAGVITGCSQHGVNVFAKGTFKLRGGSIEGNTSKNAGVGVYVQSGAVVSISGAPRVVNNTVDGIQNNVHIAADNVVTVDGELANGASIGITKLDEQNNVATSALTAGYKAANQTVDPSAYFTSDNVGHVVVRTQDGEEARLATAYTVSVAEGIQNGTVTTSVAKAAEGETVTVVATPAEGYKLDKLTVVDSQNKAVEVSNNTFVMPASNVAVFATFAAPAVTSTHTITFDANGGQGTMDPQTMVEGEATNLAANKFTRTDYTFAGWNTKANGTGSAFRDRASVKLSSDVTLYAQWTKTNTNTSATKTATTGTTATATKAASSSALANTGDPVSVAAVAAVVASGVAAVVTGTRKKR